jgi:type VI secretion system VasD/TssJ family lipoprotein
MFTSKRGLTVVLLCGALALLLGVGGCCTLGLKKCVITDHISLAGDAHLNACSGDNDGYAVVVRAYYLSDKTAFESADQRDLWTGKSGVLSESLVSLAFEKSVVPAAAPLIWEGPRPEGARWLGLVANFCKREGDGWRWVGPLDDAMTASVHLKDVRMNVQVDR